MTSPLTDILKKDEFGLEVAERSFLELKKTLMLAFVVEIDASGKGIGAVLLQNEHPIAYFSRKISLKRQHTSTYAKELLAVTALFVGGGHL